jgi:hypothetical protein
LAEVQFEIDAAIAARIGGADVWSAGPHGEAKLSWRVGPLADVQGGSACNPAYSRLLEVEVAGPVARPDRQSWRLTVPFRALLQRAYRGIKFTELTDVLKLVRGVSLGLIPLIILLRFFFIIETCKQPN